MNLRDTLNIKNNNLYIGGVSCRQLVEQFGTPLYVMDEDYVRGIMRSFKETLKNYYGEGNICYASKAFCTKAIYAIAKSEGICSDVVSMGEMYTALQAGLAAENLYFHGNAKTDAELKFAIDNRIGHIMVDNFDEIESVNALAKSAGITQKVVLRINPGVDAHTHKFIQTSKPDSKFGFNIANGQAREAVLNVLKCDNLQFRGLNCHIGSQIFDKSAFVLAADIMTDFIAKLKDDNVECQVLSLGGGFGVHYCKDDPKYNIEQYCEYLKTIILKLKEYVERKSIKKPELLFEPGRSVVAEAGITLYSVVGTKEIKDIKKYVAIDGGMGDNIRPALYEAEYDAILANKAEEQPQEIVSIAGKFCESSDIIIKDIQLPKAEKGDIVAVFTTGAYNYSMASNYNRNPIPAVVLVKDGKADYIVKPQRLEDLVRNDVIPDRLKEERNA